MNLITTGGMVAEVVLNPPTVGLNGDGLSRHIPRSIFMARILVHDLLAPRRRSGERNEERGASSIHAAKVCL